MTEAVDQGREISEGDLEALSDGLRTARQEEELDALTTAVAHMGDLYSRLTDLGNITNTQIGSRGRICQMLIDAEWEINALKDRTYYRIEPDSLEHLIMQDLGRRPWPLPFFSFKKLKKRMDAKEEDVAYSYFMRLSIRGYAIHERWPMLTKKGRQLLKELNEEASARAQ